VPFVQGFSPKPSLIARPATHLSHSAFVAAEHEDEAIFLMNRARECAFSDSCSVQDAEHYLDDVIHVQYGCAAGTIAGHALCEQQDEVAEIVAHLRAKIEKGHA
jgi:hypothetical protein